MLRKAGGGDKNEHHMASAAGQHDGRTRHMCCILPSHSQHKTSGPATPDSIPEIACVFHGQLLSLPTPTLPIGER